jgi:hypothetical protein
MPVKVRYFGFFALDCRKRLVALHLQPEQECIENLDESEAVQEPADLIPILCCPNCGQPLLFQHSIQPTGRCPP